MKLHGYWRSTSTWRVRIALAHKGLPYEYVPVNLAPAVREQDAPGFERLSPLRQVPVLEWEEGGAVVRLTQSMAILEFLEEKHPEPPLLSERPLPRARTRELAEMINSGIQPLQNTSVLLRVERLAGAEAARQWVRDVVGRGLEAVEARARAVAGRHAVGDAVTLADVLLVPQLDAARRFGVDLDPYPTLRAIEAACSELPAFRAAHPSMMPDAPSGAPRDPPP